MQSQSPPEWLQHTKIASLFQSKEEYAAFIENHEAHKHILDELKHQLAGD